ncbi:hypothetical protein IWQ48_003271 [Labrenzia sp. EL_13]|nr:hypothetical protein [Labrenzia sp. EL_13]
MSFERILLAFAATGLIPIALGYGFSPNTSAPILYGFEIEGVNQPHIFRAVMGLYFGQIFFWYLGFLNQEFRRPALYMLATFMLGLAIGRLISVVIDGIPNSLLLLYLFLELLIGTSALVALRHGKEQSDSDEET